MKRCKAIRASHGFQRRYWEEGQIVELADDVEVPPHFQLIEGDVQEVKIPTIEPMALSQLGQRPIPKTGMAAGLKDQDPPQRRKSK